MNAQNLDPRKDIFIYKKSTSSTKSFRKLSTVELKKIMRLTEEDKKINLNHIDLKNQIKINDLNNFPIINQPEFLTTKLMDYQLFGVSWMLAQENSDVAGGILADEMGMGKTVQTIGLILSGAKSEMNLIVLPTIAINQWIDEIEKHAPNMFTIFKHHGRNKITDKSTCRSDKYNVILTSYGTLESDYRRGNSVLHEIDFHRIILDEAHSIKDSRSSTSTAISHIKARIRWGLTGTPVQNRVGDLFSLIKFLRLDPYAFYFCKKCSCKSMFWLRYNEKESFSRRGFCVCGHFSAQHFGWWNRKIANPIKELGYTEEGKRIFDNLHDITKRIILRRTKNNIEEEFGLPSKVVVIDRLFFNEKELDFYKSLYTNTKSKYDDFYLKGQVLNNYAHIFDLLQKMRLAANHPFLVYRNSETTLSDIPICGYCNEECNDPVMAKCKHVFCREEAQNFLNYSPLCPVCKIKITIDFNSVYDYSIKTRIDPNSWISSTKIEYLVQQLSSLKGKNSSQKSLIFSQYVNFLEILRWRLERAGFRCVKIYGSMQLSQRRAAIDTFNTDGNVTVFLISLKAGGVALNLTEANNVFLMDLWWNPAVEEQAMDRIHRIGQHRPIRIHKIIIENSIESKILALQNKKKALFDSAIEKDYSAVEKLSEDDLHFLFN